MATHADFDKLQDFANEVLRRGNIRTKDDIYVREVATKHGLLNSKGLKTHLLIEHVINLDLCDWERIKKAASESNWIPEEYYQNDWVADVCEFLKARNKND